ncbi:hypothetical protein MOQ_006374 [Trypanosoma cruzi marinkellei]|uniref:Cation/H+ exchanger domain-containing protein n=1 Tax=Trypanosoma cruzi marinkellei TaxID=85056 RepID=K2MRX7_TRYCR|nr:hypothetical protein MOQ_006374 [Trypanosoma cruzi marinkellei]
MNRDFRKSKGDGKKKDGRRPSQRGFRDSSKALSISPPNLPGFCDADQTDPNSQKLSCELFTKVSNDANSGGAERHHPNPLKSRLLSEESFTSKIADGEERNCMGELFSSAVTSVKEFGRNFHNNDEEPKLHSPLFLPLAEFSLVPVSANKRTHSSRRSAFVCVSELSSSFDSREAPCKSLRESKVDCMPDKESGTVEGEEVLKTESQQQSWEKKISGVSSFYLTPFVEDAEREKKFLDAFNELSGDSARLTLLHFLWNKYFQPLERRRSYTAGNWDELRKLGPSENCCGFEVDRERLCLYISILRRKYRCFPCSFLLRAIYIILFWGVMYLFSPSAFSHGGLYFDTITTILFAGILGSFISRLIFVPSLVCITAAGILYGNIPRTAYLTSGISIEMCSFVNTFGMAVGVVRAGLSMNAQTFKKQFFPYILFGMLPLLSEALVNGFMSKMAFNYPNFNWAMLQGFIVSSAAPGVLAPALMELQNKGYGTKDGPGMLLLTSVLIEASISMLVIQLLVALEFSTVSTRFAIIAFPLQIIIGLIGGAVFGILVFYAVFYVLFMESERITLENGTSKLITMRHAEHVHNRCVLLLLLINLAIICASRYVSCVGGGIVMSLVLDVTFNVMCTQSGIHDHMELRSEVLQSFAKLWDYVAMPAMFAFAGAGINVHEIFDRRYIVQSIGIIMAGLAVRFIFAALTPFLTRMGFSWRELLFCGIGFLGKGSVQGAMGTVALIYATEMLREAKSPEEIAVAQKQLEYASLVRNAAVISTIIACPICSIFLHNFGERLLKRDAEELDIVMMNRT